jgi:hypothetical protein
MPLRDVLRRPLARILIPVAFLDLGLCLSRTAPPVVTVGLVGCGLVLGWLLSSRER